MAHRFPCKSPDCEFCETRAEDHAHAIAEARAEDEMRDMESRYERWLEER